MNKLSSGDKSTPKVDLSLARLLDLDGEIMEVGGGCWVALRVKRVPVSAAKPHGIDYSLAMIGPRDERLVCYDNAHPSGGGGARGKKRAAADHRHIRQRTWPYAYRDAETLMQDFWTDVERMLKEEGVP